MSLIVSLGLAVVERNWIICFTAHLRAAIVLLVLMLLYDIIYFVFLLLTQLLTQRQTACLCIYAWTLSELDCSGFGFAKNCLAQKAQDSCCVSSEVMGLTSI